MLDHILMKCHYLCSLTYVDKMSHFTRFDAFWQNVAIYALCQAQNFGCQALSTIMHPWGGGLANYEISLSEKTDASELLEGGGGLRIADFFYAPPYWVTHSHKVNIYIPRAFVQCVCACVS